ncbi:MAG: hypothetical protein A4E61_01555 [Syntrophorhabdus sp. PtaB.Bin184]|nr:MAG: hypothetical protein A4E61_01555 [Syntrophorhabdus sp. PtaB.Bin184]
MTKKTAMKGMASNQDFLPRSSPFTLYTRKTSNRPRPRWIDLCMRASKDPKRAV